MLEGKEVQGKIHIGGEEAGSYSVDAKSDTTVEAAASLNKSFLEGLIGVEAGLKLNIKPLAGLKLLAKKINKPVFTAGVEALEKMVEKAIGQ
jgi:hypothetical protein